VLVPGGRESWTLLGDDGEVVEPAERYLAYLAAIERSPNTVRAYAISLKLWFEFLQHTAVSWDEAGVEDVARFVAWLRAPAGNVIVLADGSGARAPATVNRYLAGVFGFYDHHARTGPGVAAGLVSWRRISRGSYKPFLHHVTKGRPIPVRPVKLPVPRRAPRTLEPAQIVAILAACEHLRDRFLLSLLAETGMRAGQALGLHHCDFVSRKREVHIVPRADNANGARAKVRSAAVVPVSAPLVRLYSEYMHAEYGGIDSDYVLSGCPDNTCCPEPGVIWAACLATASGKAVFASEVGIISWSKRIVTCLIRCVIIALSGSTGGEDDGGSARIGRHGPACRRVRPVAGRPRVCAIDGREAAQADAPAGPVARGRADAA